MNSGPGRRSVRFLPLNKFEPGLFVPFAVAISGPPTAQAGALATYVLTVSNARPQTATRVVATLNLPAAASVQLLPAACSVAEATGAPIAATAASDLPGEAVANNSAAADAGDSADVPTLPEWAAMLLAGLLIGRGGLRRKVVPAAVAGRR